MIDRKLKLFISAVLWKRDIQEFIAKNFGIGSQLTGVEFDRILNKLPDAKSTATAGVVSKKKVSVKNIDQRVSYIKKLILEGKEDSRIRALALQIVDDAGVAGREHVAEIRAIFDYVQQNVTFRSDVAGIESFQDANLTLTEWQAGDCDDFVIALGSLLGSIGYAVKIKVVAVGSLTFNHVYLLAEVPRGRWIAVDASVNKPMGWEPEGNHAKEYEI